MADVTAILDHDAHAGPDPGDDGDGAREGPDHESESDSVPGFEFLDAERAEGEGAVTVAAPASRRRAPRATALAALASVTLHFGVAAGAYVLLQPAKVFAPARAAFGWGDGAASVGLHGSGAAAAGGERLGPAPMPQSGTGSAPLHTEHAIAIEGAEGGLTSADGLPAAPPPSMPGAAAADAPDDAIPPKFGAPAAVMDTSPPFRRPEPGGGPGRHRPEALASAGGSSSSAASAAGADGRRPGTAGTSTESGSASAGAGGGSASAGSGGGSGSAGGTGTAGVGSGRPGIPAGVRGGRLPRPVYPSVSRRLGEEGTVLLEVEVRADGSVGRITVVSDAGFPRLAAAAADTVRRTPFTPAHSNGLPVASRVRIPFRFTLR